MTMILSLAVEVTVFALYNFEHSGFSHFIFKISIILAFIYFMFTLFSLMNVFCHPMHSNTDPDKYDFLYNGINKKGISKYFSAF